MRSGEAVISIDLSIHFEPRELLDLLQKKFLPEMQRISGKSGKPLYGSQNARSVDNFRDFIRFLSVLLNVTDQKCLEGLGYAPPIIRIEMQTFDDAFIRFRFVPMNESFEPLLPEIENPLLLFLPREGDGERFRKEGYTYVAAMVRNNP
ncbi:hypothetical protein KGO95_01115 [Patescibacteria group bacterium]|nr:hypothetical protein [Patescibacteria group bacterium]